jgi:hypothetical protein
MLQSYLKEPGFKATINKYTEKYVVTAINDYVKYSDLKIDDVMLEINDKNIYNMAETELKRFLNDCHENLIKKLTVYRPYVSDETVGSFPVNQKTELHISEPIVLTNMNASPLNSSTPMRAPMISPVGLSVQTPTVEDVESVNWKTEDIRINKINGAMGLSIVGGGSVACHPFGVNEPGIFISKIVTHGAASRTSLRVGDRLLKVNGVDVTQVTHDEAVDELKRHFHEVLLTVRHDPQPSGLKEIILQRSHPEETLGIRINGGIENKSANPNDSTDEGIFVIDVGFFCFFFSLFFVKFMNLICHNR